MPAPFILGTVQLGLDYGVANRAGQPSRAEAFGVLDAALQAGISTLDTAHGYGTSEEVIGEWSLLRSVDPRIITKLPPLGGAVAAAEAAFGTSLDRLRRSQVEVLLLHRATDWATPGLGAWLALQRKRGSVQRIGVSVYAAADIPDDPAVEVVQLPGNVFVQDEARSRVVESLLRRGGSVHLRSILAQGLLLMAPDAVPPALREAKPFVAGFQAMAHEEGVSLAALAVACARRLLDGVDLVIGAESPEQVAALAQSARTPVGAALADAALALGRSAPPQLFDPRRWPKTGLAR